MQPGGLCHNKRRGQAISRCSCRSQAGNTPIVCDAFRSMHYTRHELVQSTAQAAHLLQLHHQSTKATCLQLHHSHLAHKVIMSKLIACAMLDEACGGGGSQAARKRNNASQALVVPQCCTGHAHPSTTPSASPAVLGQRSVPHTGLAHSLPPPCVGLLASSWAGAAHPQPVPAGKS